MLCHTSTCHTSTFHGRRGKGKVEPTLVAITLKKRQPQQGHQTNQKQNNSCMTFLLWYHGIYARNAHRKTETCVDWCQSKWGTKTPCCTDTCSGEVLPASSRDWQPDGTRTHITNSSLMLMQTTQQWLGPPQRTRNTENLTPSRATPI